MKSFLRTTLFITLCLVFASCKNNTSNPAMEGLCKRVLPLHADRFVFEVSQNDSLSDFFEIESINNKICIRGNNNNSMAVGLNYYLKYFCHINVSWFASDSIVSPALLPVIPEKIQSSAFCKNRFFLNYCTFGYTMPYWEWQDWERAIDWMALNGITMPLAITGQESIWLKVWQKFGIGESEILNYFTGPAHLPWHRMSNVDYWQGPLPLSWLEHQENLQKKILAREREFNMTPVLPAFSGHVPKELKEIYPEADIKTMSQWGGYDEQYRSHFLYPMDSLFTQIQQEYMTEMIRTFGTDHIYGIDPFNEVESPDWSTEYLSNVSKTIYNSIAEIDSAATWVQMTWLFYHQNNLWTPERINAYLTAVPKEKMILLDYYCDSTELWKTTDSFFGQPFIWCYLGNFGGNTMITGDLDRIDKRLTETFRHNKENLAGIGSTLEGFDVNPFIYEYLFEKAWSSCRKPEEWMDQLAIRRGGENVRKVWVQLHKQIYKDYARAGQSTLTNARPTLVGTDSWNTHPDINYENKDLFKLWKDLILANGNECSEYNYDIVNIGRQVLGNQFAVERDLFTAAYNNKDMNTLVKKGNRMLEILDDMEALLSTHSSFLLGNWIQKARLIGTNEIEKDYYEENAKCILTTWGQKGSQLNDYANRTWAGLTQSYYRERWRIFIADVQQSLKNGKEFNYKNYKNDIIEFEERWIKERVEFSNIPQGNTIEIARQLSSKYSTCFE